MSIITRAEAAYRLKIICGKLNSAISAVRDGDWDAGSADANEALDLLAVSCKHLDEASADAPIPTGRVGGMGYRGNSHREEKPLGSLQYGTPPPEPIRVNTKPPVPIKQQPIVTPPPVLPRLNAPEPIVKFDLSRISGQPEWCAATRNGAASLTEEEWEITELFDRMTKEMQDHIATQYRNTGAPVLVRIKRGGQ